MQLFQKIKQFFHKKEEQDNNNNEEDYFTQIQQVKIKFKKKVHKNKIQQLFTQPLYDKMLDKRIQIDGNIVKHALHFPQIFQLSQYIQTNVLVIGCLQSYPQFKFNSSILYKMVFNTHLTVLKSLILTHNCKIASIQFLQCCHLQNLIEIDFHGSKLSVLKSFRKINTKNLGILKIATKLQQIVDFQYLRESNFNKKRFLKTLLGHQQQKWMLYEWQFGLQPEIIKIGKNSQIQYGWMRQLTKKTSPEIYYKS